MEFNAHEIDQLMDRISSISDEKGKGTTRLLYSPAWREAQNFLSEKFKELGMKVEFDEVGNLFGTLEGSEEPEKVIASGSHVDTVFKGGRLDGQLGIVSSYLAIRELLKEKGQPKKSLRVISMAEEEGSRFPYAFWGSKNIFGLADNKDVIDAVDKDGIKFTDAMQESGFDFLEGEPRFSDMEAFIELHIEQGNFLEKNQLKVGVVNSIVGQKRYTVKLVGESNHAGTTLMAYRHDTVECFARIVTQSLDKAKKVGDPLVLTFGKVAPQPNTVNVVPGQTEFSIDCRHTDEKVLNDFTKELENDIKEIAQDMGITVEIDQWMDELPVPMDDQVVQVIEDACKENDLSYQIMHSGAGHDAQIFAPRVPTGLIFVPSINGISHNPEEHTEAEDIVQGVKALASSLEKLAY